jgi:Holliday junction DNA helicase RuvA
MIGKLRGIVDSKGTDWVVIDVNGVGYHVTCSSRTLEALPASGGAATLAIETKVSEDAIRLIGFMSEYERDWFRLLLSVQGVGTKVALGLLGTLSPQDLATAIAMEDKRAVSAAPGVGPKVAARIVSELKDKRPSGHIAFALPSASGANGLPKSSAAQDAVSALLNLGYQQAQASAAVASAANVLDKDATPEQLIRQGLKELAR